MQFVGIGAKVARLVAAVGIVLGSGANTAIAEEATTSSPLVVELYTSQGCSSCPPADALLHELAKRDDVIALALHVDYWDYIGWADSFARAQHTVRQKAYARAAGERMIYTPQMVLDGTHRIQGTKAMALMSAIEARRAQPDRVALEVALSDGEIFIEAHALSVLDTTLLVQLVRYSPKNEVSILRGENAGKMLTYANVVTAWDTVAEWDGADPISMRVAANGDDPAVVLVQEDGYGAILAAAEAQ